MADRTGIAWVDSTWNPMTGCTNVSAGCDHCYAETLVERWSSSGDGRSTAFPAGFDPTFKPQKLRQVAAWSPRRVFVNSLSDVHHEAFDVDTVDAVYDTMLANPQHDYVVLTKRPQRMARYLSGPTAGRGPATRAASPSAADAGWLARRGLARVPDHIWVGTSIENDRYEFRLNWLRVVPAAVRVVSFEPLIGPIVPDLTGIAWAIVGGESGSGYRPMDLAWAVDIAEICAADGVSYFYKQSAGARPGTGDTLLGRRIQQFPLPHPSTPERRSAPVGIY